ncbi:NupC/NupG family nucleoside CNT transporter [Desmospora profundinema]|uniref:Nucleoside permease n=1 Tax=Desmospora profundinema TaxID=1571184 RepID=A0ABU1INW3_9BACL|nr:NupC/NupG family nucleoside CNT transporter [Desmospora profundinema]MDR6226401.1 CNT family concentrative nucleoside transporter [Desmospora profundinema]
MDILWGIGGILTVLLIAFLFSDNRSAIRPRTVLGGLAIQWTFAWIVLQWETGKAGLQWLSFQVQKLIQFANDGIAFLFGELLQGNEGPIFALQVLPIIIFFSALISVLYHLGMMQWVIRLLGGGVSKLLHTSRAESLSATANIFVGQTEAPLVVRPYIKRMTASELFAVMTGGFASVAGSVLVGYSLLGIPLEYLLAASFMAAPAGLVMAKIMKPETDTPVSPDDVELVDEIRHVNVIEAAASGALEGLRLVLNIAALLLAFIALIALMNGVLGTVGGWIGIEGLSLEMVLGVIFSPLAFIIGVPWSEALVAGNFIGQKIVLNEFVAYSNFAPTIDQLSPKTVAVVTFALCGFANLGSIAIQMGALGGMAPNRRSEIAQFGLRAVLAGTLASLLSAAIAGMLIG